MLDYINKVISGIEPNVQMLLCIVFGVLLFSSVVASVLTWKFKNEKNQDTFTNLNQRINSWWMMMLVFFTFFFLGYNALIILFGLISFFCFREFISINETKNGDTKVLTVSFFIVLPLQFYFIWNNWYGMVAIFIPVYAFLILPAIAALHGQVDKFLERTSMIQWGLMICVYCVSCVPAMLLLNLKDFTGNNALLMIFFLIVVQISDVMQYVFGKLFGKHKIAPVVSPSKTVEGLVGGGLAAILIGGALHWLTPFGMWYAMLMSSVIVVMGFLGGLILSAVKRSIGVKDWGTLIKGHGGVLDRMDSVCFAAPIFFHLTRYFFSA